MTSKQDRSSFARRAMLRLVIGGARLLPVLWGCSGEPQAPKETIPPLDPSARAEEVLGRSTLPPRLEVGALGDLLLTEAETVADSAEKARRVRLAARLREQAFRVEGVASDGVVAMELLARATELEQGSEQACRSDRARALLAGDVAGDAIVTYRELYLAKQRQSRLAKSECVGALDQDLARLAVFRPSGEAWARLLSDGDRQLQKLTRASATAASPSSSSPPEQAIAPGDRVVSPVVVPSGGGPVRVTKIDHYQANGGGRVVLWLTGPAAFEVGNLEKDGDRDPRVFVDVVGASVKGQPREIPMGGAIKRIRTAPRQGGSRVVLDLAASVDKKVFYLPQPFRIVIDVRTRVPGRSGFEPKLVRRVAIDPGHGGHDAGAVGPSGLKEKDITLDIAHRVAPVLADELGLETLLTRDDDSFVPLDERTLRANAFHADLFVSIHCNASETGDAHGIEVFVLDEHKDQSRAARRIAALENGLALDKALDSPGLDLEMADIAGRLGSGEIASSSRRLGLLLGKTTLASLGERYPDTSDHGLKSAGFYVLAGAEMPAVLFETSFISNPNDEGRLAKADYRQRLADAIVNAIRAYREGR